MQRLSSFASIRLARPETKILRIVRTIVHYPICWSLNAKKSIKRERGRERDDCAIDEKWYKADAIVCENDSEGDLARRTRRKKKKRKRKAAWRRGSDNTCRAKPSFKIRNDEWSMGRVWNSIRVRKGWMLMDRRQWFYLSRFNLEGGKKSMNPWSFLPWRCVEKKKKKKKGTSSIATERWITCKLTER